MWWPKQAIEVVGHVSGNNMRMEEKLAVVAYVFIGNHKGRLRDEKGMMCLEWRLGLGNYI